MTKPDPDMETLDAILGDARPAYRALDTATPLPAIPVPAGRPRGRRRVAGGVALAAAAVFASVLLLPTTAPPARLSLTDLPRSAAAPLSLRSAVPDGPGPSLGRFQALAPAALPRRPRPGRG